MQVSESTELCRSLCNGTVEVALLHELDGLSLEQLRNEVAAAYPIAFLGAVNRTKRELGLATSRDGGAFKRCLIATEEDGRITSLTLQTCIRIDGGEGDSHRITSGGGFSLCRDVDGWIVKLLEECTVTIPRATAERYGWRLLEQV